MNAGDVRYDMVLTNPLFGKKSGLKVMKADGSVDAEKENYWRPISSRQRQINKLIFCNIL